MRGLRQAPRQLPPGRSRGEGLARGVGLVELVVSLSLLTVASALLWQAMPKAAAERSADRRVDDIQVIHLGLERIKRTLETSRAILYPPERSGPPARQLVFRDARDRLTVWTVSDGALRERAFGTGAPGTMTDQVLLDGCDAALFDFRGTDERVIRLQLFVAGLSFITSVRYFNNMSRRSLEPLEELFGP